MPLEITSITSGSRDTVLNSTITTILSPDATNSMGGNPCKLYRINPNNPADTSEFLMTDTIFVFCRFTNIAIAGDSIFSGDSITFLVGESLVGSFDTATITFFISDNNLSFTPPKDTIVECQSDPSVAMLGNVMNVSQSCSGIKDTIYRDSIVPITLPDMDTIQRILRIWSVTENSNIVVTDTQRITIIDTIPPVWDTMQIATNTFLQNDSLFWNNSDTLMVVLDTSGISGANTSAFWTNTFVPMAFDSCFGVLDTLSISNILTDSTRFNNGVISGSGSSIMANNVAFSIEKTFEAAAGGTRSLPNFVLQLFFIDTLPPVVVDTPFYAGGALDMAVDLFSSGTSGSIDTFIVFNDMGTCDAQIDSAAIDIIVNDNFDQGGVVYSWRVDSLSGMSPPITNSPGGFTSTNNDAAQTYPVGQHKITYLFRDTSNQNLDSLQFVLEVRDTQPPVIALANAEFREVLYYNTINAGNCDQEFTYQQPDLTSTYVMDNCGADTSELTITRVLSADSNPGIFTNSNQGTFGVMDYGDNVTIDLPIDTTTIYYIYEDRQGNKDTISYVFDVRDTIPPVVNCVSSMLDLKVSGTDCTGALPDYRSSVFVSASDICGLDSIQQLPEPGTIIGIDTMITFIAVDMSGNGDTCSVPLQIMGVQAPVVMDTTTECTSLTLNAPLLITNCSDTIALQPLSGEVENGTTPKSYTFTQIANNGARTINWFYDDASGLNIISHEITFIADTTNPTIIVPVNTVSLSLDSMGMLTINPMSLDSASYDNCTSLDSLKLTTDITSIPCDSLGKTFDIKLYVADESMNIDSQDVTVTIVDTLAPIFMNVPDSLYLVCAADVPGQAMLTVVENCGMIDTMYMDTISTRPDTPTIATLEALLRDSAYYNFDITYIWHAVDTAGNRDSVQQVIQVRDTLAPVINLDTLYLVQTGENSMTCSGTITLDLLGNINDQCSDTLKYLAIASQDSIIRHDTLEMITLDIPMGDTTIYIIAEDFSNNRDTHKIDIKVDDLTDPTPRCNNAVAVTINAFGFAAIDSSVVDLNSIDNCTISDNLRFELSQDTFRCADIGQDINIIMTVTDAAGNSAFCQSTVTVQDFAGTGSFACPADITIACDASRSPDSTGAPMRMDVCGTNSSLTFADSIVAGPSGTTNICQIIERSWTLTDTVTGTVTTCLQRISLIDDDAPELDTTYADAIVSCIDAAMTLTADSILATDNCMEDFYVHAQDSFTMGVDTILLRRIWAASDNCRTTADTQFIKIVDDLAPTIALPADTFVYNTGDLAPDSCGVFVNLDFATYVTDCNATFGLGISYQVQDSMTQDTTILSQYFTIGEHSVIITARDSSNNVSKDTLIIDVNDTSTPSVFCVENIVVSLGSGGTGVLQVSDVFIRSTDNCGQDLSATLASLSKTTFDCSDLGTQQVALTVTDTSGNVGTCMVLVNVVNQGNTDFISIETSSKDESIIGLNDGEAWINVIGGSGNYTVQWDNAAMSTTDTIKNLAPALYTVTVNDTTSGCILTDTIRVNGGNMVTYEIGAVEGLPGTIVQVPVRVTNFTNVTSIDMSFILSNPAVGQFVGGNEAGGFNVPGINLTSFNIDPDNASRLLVGANLDVQSGETVPDGTVIFYVNVQLTPNATIGSATNITGDGNSETDIKTGLLINDSPVDLIAQSTSGSVSVTNVTNSLSTFGGQINLINGNPLANATVVLSGAVTSEDSTGTDGVYNTTVTTGQNITITPSENENARNGLSTFDLVLIQDHINLRLLDSPYKRLAADVNKSGSITVLDIIEIQDVILKRVNTFAEVPSWVFVPADHTFADTMNPYTDTNLPTSITIASASTADTAMNFVAVKTGDVSLDAEAIRLREGAAATDRNKDFTFQVTEQLLTAGTYVEIPFKANNFNDIRGYQMTLDIAKESLTFESVKAGALTNITTDNFSFTNIARGQIATNWFDATAQTVADGATLFTLVFKVNQTGNRLSEVLAVTSDMIRAEAYTNDWLYNGIGLAFEENLAIEETFELFQNKPNPFRSETTISFNLPENAPVTLRFFDFSGRLVHQIKGDYTRGTNNITVRKNELSANGVLYYELSTIGFTARKKMIVLE
ncbi:MAG: cohesin domain-containing protein [Saprospiraceae bacterium]